MHGDNDREVGCDTRVNEFFISSVGLDATNNYFNNKSFLVGLFPIGAQFMLLIPPKFSSILALISGVVFSRFSRFCNDKP